MAEQESLEDYYRWLSELDSLLALGLLSDEQEARRQQLVGLIDRCEQNLLDGALDE